MSYFLLPSLPTPTSQICQKIMWTKWNQGFHANARIIYSCPFEMRSNSSGWKLLKNCGWFILCMFCNDTMWCKKSTTPLRASLHAGIKAKDTRRNHDWFCSCVQDSWKCWKASMPANHKIGTDLKSKSYVVYNSHRGFVTSTSPVLAQASPLPLKKCCKTRVIVNKCLLAILGLPELINTSRQPCDNISACDSRAC